MKSCERFEKTADKINQAIDEPTNVTEPCENIVSLSVDLQNLHIHVNFQTYELVKALRILRNIWVLSPCTRLETMFLEHSIVA